MIVIAAAVAPGGRPVVSSIANGGRLASATDILAGLPPAPSEEILR